MQVVLEMVYNYLSIKLESSFVNKNEVIANIATALINLQTQFRVNG